MADNYQEVAKNWVKPVKKPRRASDLAKPSTLETAADRRNWLRKRAGWPVKGT